MKPDPWPIAGILALLQVGLSWYHLLEAPPKTFVFTPIIDVVPGGVPLSGNEANALLAETRYQADSRDIQQAYARMGSTFSLDDLLRGIEGLEDLDSSQRSSLSRILTDARAQHVEVKSCQERILDLEAKLDQQMTEILPVLPMEIRNRMQAEGRPGGAGAHPSQPSGTEAGAVNQAVSPPMPPSGPPAAPNGAVSGPPTGNAGPPSGPPGPPSGTAGPPSGTAGPPSGTPGPPNPSSPNRGAPGPLPGGPTSVAPAGGSQ